MIFNALKQIESSIPYWGATAGLSSRAPGTGRQVGNLSYRRGFTLLEVILALGLSLVLIAAIGSAIALYTRLFDSGRTNIEEAQLARALLRRMADDIRGAVLHSEVDVSKLVSAVAGSTSGTSASSSGGSTSSASSSSGSSASSANNSASGDSATDESMLDTSALEESLVDELTDLSSTGPQNNPGLYGNACQLQIDVSRLPRIDQYMLAEYQDAGSGIDPLTGAPSVDRVSDLRNVSYYIFGDAATIAMGSSAGMPMGFGLLRRDIDRAAALYSAQNGMQADLDAAAELIAPEVESIQFAYYDGYSWYDCWDSTQNGGLPMAVQITLAIARPAKKNGEIPPPGVYSLLVSLPLAKPATSTDMSSSGTEESSSSSSGSQDSSSSTPSGSSSSNTPAPTTNNTPSPSKNTSGQNNPKK
jgi:prepilin-type N-terminal cleavage/methylation domain-containing protein